MIAYLITSIFTLSYFNQPTKAKKHKGAPPLHLHGASCHIWSPWCFIEIRIDNVVNNSTIPVNNIMLVIVDP